MTKKFCVLVLYRPHAELCCQTYPPIGILGAFQDCFLLKAINIYLY